LQSDQTTTIPEGSKKRGSGISFFDRVDS
jgi:hypothetical protein